MCRMPHDANKTVVKDVHVGAPSQGNRGARPQLPDDGNGE